MNDQEYHDETIKLVNRLEAQNKPEEAKLALKIYLANFYRVQAFDQFIKELSKIKKLLSN